MPGILTEITEIATALGMTGHDTLASALAARPQLIRNVEAANWERLDEAFADGGHAGQFAEAWENGRTFYESPDGLRGRDPERIEWKGPHRQQGYDTLPADLRVDHVYLVSCKYQSRILTNSSPANLFLRRLADRTQGQEPASWFATAAPDQYEYFYSCLRRFIGQPLLPVSLEDLTLLQIDRIRTACNKSWPAVLVPLWEEFSLAVAIASAEIWRQQLVSSARKVEMLWRLLRLGPTPYFVLGSSPTGPMRLRIGTPWDWSQSFDLESLMINERPAGQPQVDWLATVTDREMDTTSEVAGHIEIRWAHGRFSSVEAKIYLDTPHADVPGYYLLHP